MSSVTETRSLSAEQVARLREYVTESMVEAERMDASGLDAAYLYGWLRGTLRGVLRQLDGSLR